MKPESEFFIRFPNLCPTTALRHIKIYIKFVGQKVDLVNGFNYQNYYLRKRYHFTSLFIHKMAWVNKTKNFDGVLKTRHRDIFSNLLCCEYYHKKICAYAYVAVIPSKNNIRKTGVFALLMLVLMFMPMSLLSSLALCLCASENHTRTHAHTHTRTHAHTHTRTHAHTHTRTHAH